MAEESYPRWLGRKLLGVPRGLKTIVAEIPGFLKNPVTEQFLAFYALGYGIFGVLLNVLFSPLYPFLLTTLQWGSVLVVSFFLFTHGIYREDKEEEAEG